MEINEEEKLNMSDIIQSLEATFDCSGICDPYNYYTFTDINRGSPPNKKGCFTEVYNLAVVVEPWGQGIALILFFSILATMI